MDQRGEVLFVFGRRRRNAQTEHHGRAVLEAVEALPVLNVETGPQWWMFSEIYGLGVTVLTRAPTLWNARNLVLQTDPVIMDVFNTMGHLWRAHHDLVDPPPRPKTPLAQMTQALATALHTCAAPARPLRGPCAAQVWSAAGRAKPAPPLWLGRARSWVPGRVQAV